MKTPFSAVPDEQVASWGELKLIAGIRTWLGDAAPAAPYGMGDDTAVLPDGTGNLLTTDSLVYGRHFNAALSPQLAGAKLLKRNLSDIAAMGGVAGVAVLAGFLPPSTRVDWVEGFVRGLADCARAWGVKIVGGDLTETTDFLGFNLSLTGHTPRAIPRGLARVGDEIWVTGELGDSLAGHHATFTPRLLEGQWLAGEEAVRTMIDVTDGLAKDLPALLSPGTAAMLDLRALPRRNPDADIAGPFTDGEDYELLFVADPRWRTNDGPERFSRAIKTRLTCIGKITTLGKNHARLCDSATRAPLDFGTGYAHFG